MSISYLISLKILELVWFAHEIFTTSGGRVIMKKPKWPKMCEWNCKWEGCGFYSVINAGWVYADVLWSSFIELRQPSVCLKEKRYLNN